MRISSSRGIWAGSTRRRGHLAQASLKQWIPAAELRKGEHLLTANGTTATADGGATTEVRDGWMWDLTIPGNGDHDFYVETGSTPVLAHNAGGPLTSQLPDLTGMSPQQAWQVLEDYGFTSNNNVSPNGYETASRAPPCAQPLASDVRFVHFMPDKSGLIKISDDLVGNSSITELGRNYDLF